MWGVYCVAADLIACQEGLYFVELAKAVVPYIGFPCRCHMPPRTHIFFNYDRRCMTLTIESVGKEINTDVGTPSSLVIIQYK
jgi:hypothetical protein